MRIDAVKAIERGVSFAKNNPQVLYTAFLVVLVPAAFFFSGEQFFLAAQKNEQRAESARISTLHDATVDIVSDTLTDPTALQAYITRVVAHGNEINEVSQISELKVGLKEGDSVRVIASNHHEEVGIIEPIGTSPTSNGFEYRVAMTTPGVTFISNVRDPATGERLSRGVQSITDAQGNIVAFLWSDISMGQLDALAAGGIRSAYGVALFLTILMVILLLRQARIADYTVLYGKLAEADKMKDDFMSMTVHELRTPLTVISGYASILTESGQLAEPDKKTVGLITRSAEQLQSLVNDMLDVMRIESGKMEFARTETDLGAVTREVAGMFEFPAKEKGLALSFNAEENMKVSVDPARLRQVLVNMVGNSIKYTPSGSVAITVSRVDGKGVIRVSDTGIGISAEDHEKMFLKFYRVRSQETKDIRGTGLGLWIARAFVERMGGFMGVESIKGKGTDVTVSFPLVG